MVQWCTFGMEEIKRKKKEEKIKRCIRSVNLSNVESIVTIHAKCRINQKKQGRKHIS